ncbi:ABC transporter permease subunit [bacterium]|nr:ABC transporter permease subunit [bacterium]
MKNVKTIMDKEIRAYFTSPMAYTALCLFLLISGVIFNSNILKEHSSEMINLFILMIYLFIMIIPALTMHLFAEERRSGTIELLMTYPIQDWEVVMGKFLAGFALFMGMLLLTFHFPLFLLMWGNPDPGAILAGYLGLILLGGTFLSIGMLATSSTKSPNVAFIMAAGVLFGLTVIGQVAINFAGTGAIADFVSYISITEHFRNFTMGTINSKDIVFYLSVIFFALFASIRLVEMRRWKN